MKKLILITLVVIGLASCRHNPALTNDPLKSDDLAVLWGPKPADLDIKIMGYAYSIGTLKYGILDVIDNTDKAKRRSLVGNRKLFVNGKVIDQPQNSDSLKPFLSKVFTEGKCEVACKGITGYGYDDFSKKVELATMFEKCTVSPGKITDKHVPIKVTWDHSKAESDDKIVVCVSFSAFTSDMGEMFTWNKITEDDGTFEIPAEVYDKAKKGFMNITLYRGSNVNFTDSKGKLISISSVTQGLSSVYIGR